MEEEKLITILEAMQGITYREWCELKHIIERRFEEDTRAVANKVQLADTQRIMESYKYL